MLASEGVTALRLAGSVVDPDPCEMEVVPSTTVRCGVPRPRQKSNSVKTFEFHKGYGQFAGVFILLNEFAEKSNLAAVNKNMVALSQRDAGFCINHPPIHYLEEPKMLDLYVKFMAWLQSEEGQGLAEYALILVLIAVVVIAALRLIGTNVNTTFSTIASGLATS